MLFKFILALNVALKVFLLLLLLLTGVMHPAVYFRCIFDSKMTKC